MGPGAIMRVVPAMSEHLNLGFIMGIASSVIGNPRFPWLWSICRMICRNNVVGENNVSTNAEEGESPISKSHDRRKVMMYLLRYGTVRWH
jgi:hypothetical protein